MLMSIWISGKEKDLTKLFARKKRILYQSKYVAYYRCKLHACKKLFYKILEKCIH